ncbi:MAG TPA: PAS domain-containing sensor histidine kinase [Candidatus Limnocylindrales bacterium]|nr:PAS domain-containing sensor histidine kinase [Candidatus Limnocylindrales bacterium]
MLADASGTMHHLNPPALRLLGLSPRQDPFGRLHDHSTDPLAVEELFRTWRRSGSVRPGAIDLRSSEHTVVRARCDGVRLDETFLLIRLSTGTSPSRLGMLNHRIEAATLRQLKERLRHMVSDLETTNRELSIRNRELEQYASAVAHDLRTPLYVIQGYAELLLDEYGGDVTEQGQELFDGILRGTERMTGVIDALLALARMEAHPPTELTDSQAALQIALREVADQLETVGARVEVGSMLPAPVQQDHLVQVFGNLVANSVKYRSADRPLELRIVSRSTVDGGVEFRFADNGRGVAESDRQRIFTLFDRGSSPGDEPGFGVGLATCRKLAESLGGSITCEESAGGGAAFVFTLPPLAQASKDRSGEERS